MRRSVATLKREENENKIIVLNRRTKEERKRYKNNKITKIWERTGNKWGQIN